MNWRLINRKVAKNSGFSLLEVLVVLTVFSALAIISTTVILLALRSTKRSDTSAKVRENVDYAIATIERHLRNSTKINNCSSDMIAYNDRDLNPATFSCVDIGNDGYLASGSARLTSAEVDVTQCQFSCSETESSVNPPTVTIAIMAKDKTKTGTETVSFSTSTQIVLRTY